MKLRYIGETFGYGIDGLTDGKIYTCLGIEGPFFRVIDDSEEDYLYRIHDPGEFEENGAQGIWEIVEDDDKGSLKNATLTHITIDWGEWRTI